MRFVSVVLLATLLGSPRLAAQGGTVALLVIDDATDVPIAQVHVSVVGETGEGLTDARGRFTYVAAKAGKVAFLLRRLGYTAGTLLVDVAASDTARVTYIMTAAPQTLARVDVRDTMTSVSPFLGGFERRLAVHAGSATYITRTEIDKRKPSLTTDLLRRVPSISR